MLYVSTELKPSRIHGIGIFTTQRIPKFGLVWRFNPQLDVVLFHGILPELNSIASECLRKYTYNSPSRPGILVLCFDDARFMNFGTPSNLELGSLSCQENDLIAARDIEVGEEITAPMCSDLDAERKLNE